MCTIHIQCTVAAYQVLLLATCGKCGQLNRSDDIGSDAGAVRGTAIDTQWRDSQKLSLTNLYRSNRPSPISTINSRVMDQSVVIDMETKWGDK